MVKIPFLITILHQIKSVPSVFLTASACLVFSTPLYCIPFNHGKEKQIQENRPCPRKPRKMLTRRVFVSQGIRSIVQSCKFLEL